MQTPLTFKPVRKCGSLAMEDFFIWGASPIYADGRYHLFASRWEGHLMMEHWVTNSEVIRASSSTPAGPYTFDEVVLGAREGRHWDNRMAHNPSIVEHEGRYYLFYTGTTYGAPRPHAAGRVPRDLWAEAWNNKRIGISVADSIYGPWERPDAPVLEVRPGGWDMAITSNAAPCVGPGGTLTLIYKSAGVKHGTGPFPGRFHLGCARASFTDLRFERLSDEPIALNDNTDTHVEDPFVWHDDEGYHILMKDMTGEVCGEAEAGIYARSEDGQHWYTEGAPLAYSRHFTWEDGTPAHPRKLERTQGLITRGGLTHLFFATSGTEECPRTRNLVFEIA